MDDSWLATLDQQTALLVPTRSLASALNERVARHYLASGQTVWEAPNILVWSDYIDRVWQLNRDLCGREMGVYSLISTPQSLLLWTQVIETSKRTEQALMLLNVQQTARAAQRSWRQMHDWQIELSAVRRFGDADSHQFGVWADAYKERLKQRALIDPSQLVNSLVRLPIQYPFARIKLFSFDLVNAAQRAFLEAGAKSGVAYNQTKSAPRAGRHRYHAFVDSKSEIRAVLQHARDHLRHNPDHAISVVVPDLQQRQLQVQELARDVFYPQFSPLDALHNNTVYQFSLGQPLQQWPAIDAALSAILLLKNRTTTRELCFVLRNQFFTQCRAQRDQCRLFERWLQQQRQTHLLLEDLPAMYRHCLDRVGTPAMPSDALQQGDNSQLENWLEKLVEQRKTLSALLADAKQTSGFAALDFAQWASVFEDWLQVWGWHTATSDGELNSVQYQLRQRWTNLLKEFAGLALVQRRAGLNRALEVLQQFARDTVFLPKAAASPLLISGVLEAIGREVDVCFVTGMHQDYPAQPQPDAFVPVELLARAGHPEADPNTSYTQAEKVMTSLLDSADECVVSYAQHDDRDPEISRPSSPLFEHKSFTEKSPQLAPWSPVALEEFTDTRGPAWADAGRVSGGSRVFEDQSNCAFRAFATHQLGVTRVDEAEFGLDGLDRGNVIHQLLNLIWQQIQSQGQLTKMDESARLRLANKTIKQILGSDSLGLTGDKAALLKLEQPRLAMILLEWLALEAERPISFEVVEREETQYGTIAGIRLRYVIDRVDVMEDGRSVVIDYKTGFVSRGDWLGERLRSPQIPLYAVLRDDIKTQPASGIAYARIKQGESKFIELAEDGIFRRATGREQKLAMQWQECRGAWPDIFDQLARAFLAGEAVVNPIDEATCRYCQLHSLCRVSELRGIS